MENRQLVWVSSSQKDLEEFPDPVKETMLFALDLAKVGGKHGKAKPFKGFSGSSVLEIVQRGKDSTFPPCIPSNLKKLFLFCIVLKRSPPKE